MTWVKICGTTTGDDALAAVEAGAATRRNYLRRMYRFGLSLNLMSLGGLAVASKAVGPKGKLVGVRSVSRLAAVRTPSS